MSEPWLGLPKPRLQWSADGAPHNLDHDDGYFSDADGLAETQAVFLGGCHLPQAWRGKSHFTIGELGFGTGLNFLSVWDMWRQNRPCGARLHFVSIEGAPFSVDDLERAHHAFAPLQPLAQKLRASWPPRVKGVHRCCFDEDGISLTLYFMDVDAALAQMEAKANAWFLDGFAPSKNLEMWSAGVFSRLAHLSHKGACAATFSVAGHVRRGLIAAGFAVAKKPGHGRKRERLEARYEGPEHPPKRRQTLIFTDIRQDDERPKSVLVIGDGIAGASAAFGFLRRGVAVTLISNAATDDKASGNPAALVSPRLDLDDAPLPRFFRTAYTHAVRTYAGFGPKVWTPCGLLRVAVHDSDNEKFARLAAQGALPLSELGVADAAFCKSVTGNADHGTALFLPKAGIVNPKAAIGALKKGASQITAEICTLARENGLWVARDAAHKPVAEAPIVVLALGIGALAQTKWLNLQHLKGQISVADVTKPYNGPAIMEAGYALGLGNNRLLTGATYEFIEPHGAPSDLQPQISAHTKNLEALQKFAPALAARMDENTLSGTTVSGRVSVRAATPDQTPYVGPLVDADDFMSRFFALKDGFLDPKVGTAILQQGLFTLMGLGARGFTLAPILGEAIAAEALGEPSPLERACAEMMHPARVLAKRIKFNGQTPL